MESSSLPSQLNVKSCLLRETGTIPGCALPNSVKLSKIIKRNKPTRLCFAASNGGFRQEKHGIGSKDGVIIVDHGSRRKESNLMLNEFVLMFRDKTGYPIVEPAHMAGLAKLIGLAGETNVQASLDNLFLKYALFFPSASSSLKKMKRLLS